MPSLNKAKATHKDISLIYIFMYISVRNSAKQCEAVQSSTKQTQLKYTIPSIAAAGREN